MWYKIVPKNTLHYCVYIYRKKKSRLGFYSIVIDSIVRRGGISMHFYFNRFQSTPNWDDGVYPVYFLSILWDPFGKIWYGKLWTVKHQMHSLWFVYVEIGDIFSSLFRFFFPIYYGGNGFLFYCKFGT